MPGHWLRIAGGLLTATALVALAACSDDSDPTATPAPSVAATEEGALNENFCSAMVAFDALDSPGGEETEAEYAAAIKDYAGGIEAPLATLTANAPPALSGAFETLNGILPRLQEGDIAAYEGPEGSAAVEAIELAASEGCGWQTVHVTATDYHFAPDQESVPAGPISFQLKNDGAEPHVFLLLRKQDGDSRDDTAIVGDFLEKVSSGDPAQIGEVIGENVSGGGPFALPGSEGSHVLDLSAGTYIYWCPIPQGDSGEGPPHFTLGMVGELTVE